jgi:ubiquinone/menaquinone biosynthesis C-methylase UbiE
VMSWQGAAWLERDDREAEEGTRKLIRRLDLDDGDTVVDLGCGTGFHARRMKREVGETGVVHCVDLQPEMLRQAAQLAQQEGVTLSLVPGEAERIPLPDAVADLVLMVDVYHELQQPAPMLAELRRVLAPGGRIAIVEFRLEGASALHIKREHRMADEQVVQELEAAGFRTVEAWDGLPQQHLLVFEAR